MTSGSPTAPAAAEAAPRAPAAGEAALRRVPRQRRSRERLERVLDAADRVLAEEGAGALTTTRVAEAAGVSVGSLYQYFPDKGAITAALALRYIGELERVMGELAERAEREPPADPAASVLDAFAAAYRERPGFRALWFGGLRTEALRDATRPSRRVVGAGLARVLAASAPGAAPEAVEAAARTAVLVADGLLREAFRLDPRGDEALLSEARTLLRGYLRERVGIEGEAR